MGIKSFTLLISSILIVVGFVWAVVDWQEESDSSLSAVVVSPRAISDDPCVYLQPSDRELTGDEAVAAAECFIIQNGYTDLPPIADRSKLTPENLYPGTDEEGMKMRHDSLESRAYSYRRDPEFFGGSWVIMFRYRPHPDVVGFYGERLGHIGRAVVMDLCGKRIRVQHSDYPLRSPEATLVKVRD